ncbi:LPP20 family lipoprotein [Moritella yayanosii]|uniref:Putative flagellar biosynthesis protein FlgP n=1 Tax=Moritella yayanosii TaxID=69539 RepID=A0A330LMU8_9GAMM|nr:LPP20 family lipoprotein [Moritella yayanosii]SQD78180.1 putative flagellar biosynthesis protein FlgP [Moritella yayanosii]
MKYLRLLMLATLVNLTGCELLEKNTVYDIKQPKTFPVLKAIGYAALSSQPGNSDSERMLNAMRASKLDAYRELAEQVSGQKIYSDTSYRSRTLQGETMEASVSGTIRGARVVQTYPVNDDVYATELELDFKRVFELYENTSAMPTRVQKTRY